MWKDPIIHRSSDHSEKKSKTNVSGKNEKPSVESVMEATRLNLENLTDRYRIFLNQQIAIARSNQRRGIENSANYGKISVAISSLKVLEEAKVRLNEMSSQQELYNCMEELNGALKTINLLGRKTGRLNARPIEKATGKMMKMSTGAGSDLTHAAGKLSGLNLERAADKVSVDTFDQPDLIRQLINGSQNIDSVLRESSMRSEERLTDELAGMREEIDADADLYGVKSSQDVESCLEEMNKMIDQL